MARRRQISNVQLLRLIQRTFDENRLCEVILSVDNARQLIEHLLVQIANMENDEDGIVLHYLSWPEQLKSSVSSKIYIQRLTTLIHMENVEMTEEILNQYSQEECIQKAVDFVRIMKDI